MTLSYWNSQYQFTKLLPDFQERLRLMERRSAAVDLDFRSIPYGPHDRQFVEMSGSPESDQILPVFVHGGYWRALTAEMHRFVLPGLAQEGNAVANLEYRLLPEVTLSEIIDDVLQGLQRLADETGADLAVVGHSAGGHLAIMSALRLPEVVKAAVGISGLYDLTSLQWSFLREEVDLRADDLDGHSPLELWHTETADHVLVAVGDAETPEFHRQTHMFASTHGARVLTVPNAHHMTVLDALTDPKSTLSAQIQSLIASASTGHSSTNLP